MGIFFLHIVFCTSQTLTDPIPTIAYDGVHGASFQERWCWCKQTKVCEITCRFHWIQSQAWKQKRLQQSRPGLSVCVIADLMIFIVGGKCAVHVQCLPLYYALWLMQKKRDTHTRRRRNTFYHFDVDLSTNYHFSSHVAHITYIACVCMWVKWKIRSSWTSWIYCYKNSDKFCSSGNLSKIFNNSFRCATPLTNYCWLLK